MSEIPRIKISELLARYQLEPAIRDIYVEGAFDQELLTAWATEGRVDCVFYEIDAVEILPELLARYGLTDGNKQRVIVLAKELGVLADPLGYRCIVDRDLDAWLGALEEVPRLRWTKYSSIETYFLERDIVKRFVVSVAKAKISRWDDLFSSFVDVLKQFYALRLSDRYLDWNLLWIDFGRSLSVINDVLIFDIEGYTTKLLNKNSRWRDREEFRAQYDRWRSKLDQHDGCCARGHDFIWLMAWLINKSKGLKNFSEVVALERLLVLAAPQSSEFEQLVA